MYYINARITLSFAERDIAKPNRLTFIVNRPCNINSIESDLIAQGANLLTNSVYNDGSGNRLTPADIIDTQVEVITGSINNFIQGKPTVTAVFSRSGT